MNFLLDLKLKTCDFISYMYHIMTVTFLFSENLQAKGCTCLGVNVRAQQLLFQELHVFHSD